MSKADKGIMRKLPSIHYFIGAAGLALMFFPLTWPIKLPQEFWVKQILIYLVWAGLFYANFFYFTPKLLYKHKIGLFVILVIFTLFAVVFFSNWVDRLLGLPQAMEKLFSSIGHKPSNKDDHTGNYINIITAMVVYGISTVVSLSKKMQTDQLAFQVTEREKIISELSFLKAQINPHFFFNTLHTIYALTDSNTGTAKDAIYTLSHMMRYVIYDTKNDLTNLNNEIKFAEDYITLMKLRLAGDVQIIFEKQANMKNYDVAPMLLLPFIENAFKHGISTLHPSYVYIDISQSEQTTIIEIKNSVFEERKHLEESNGIGIVNTKRRLDLLYPGKYTLNAENNTTTREYTVTLTLDFK
ncbi:sensor histidine kinase [Pedobacter antarcticus]|uniref:sensor histidine kinase n=1 Tax=Pedobacter antarcticus TaxID=34086 RepID=UPI001C565FC9|nr:histidine kinase [Pedobacter antarcticus]